MKLSLAITILLFCSCALGQVEIRIPQQHYKAGDTINVFVRNANNADISFCVEYRNAGGTNTRPSEAKPTPIYVEHADRLEWDTLLIGRDIGGVRHSVTLPPGDSQHYPLVVRNKGRFHAILEYRIGATD